MSNLDTPFNSRDGVDSGSFVITEFINCVSLSGLGVAFASKIGWEVETLPGFKIWTIQGGVLSYGTPIKIKSKINLNLWINTSRMPYEL